MNTRLFSAGGLIPLLTIDSGELNGVANAPVEHRAKV